MSGDGSSSSDGCWFRTLVLNSSLTVQVPKYAKTGCSYRCGNVRIPYPFGNGARCSVNRWYTIDCNSNTPYLSALNHLEIMSVNLRNKTATVSTPTITNCQNPVRNSSKIMGADLGGSPFFFPKSNNKFVFRGCGNAIMKMDDGSVLTASSTACGGVTLNDQSSCFGIGDCCETTIPYNFKSYTINLTSLGDEDGGCASAFLVDQTSYDHQRRNTSFIPVSFQWTITDSDQVTCCENFTPYRGKVVMFDGTTVDTLTCYTPLSH